DEHGFDWFSVSDHFQETPGRGGGEPCLESVAILTAAALETKRVRVGCLVFCVSYRHPIVLAKALTAIDLLSSGRVTCGLAAGWNVPYISPADWAAKSAVLDQWCERVKRDGREITRTVNVGFYMGADEGSRRRAAERFTNEWGASETRTGFLRGGVSEAAAV